LTNQWGGERPDESEPAGAQARIINVLELLYI